MSAPSPGQSSGPRRPPADESTRIFYSRLLGWLVLAMIVAYAGLQMPMPWRVMTVIVGGLGVVGGVVLFVSCIRRRLSTLVLIGSVLVTLSCGLFLIVAGAQTLFWEASVAFDECVRSAVTQRSVNHCYSQYEQDILSSIPGAQ